jgi:hypothetical protein
MVPLSIMGMTGRVNPCCLAVRRPWILFVARRRSAGAFFVGTPALVRHPFWLIIQRTPLGLDSPLIHILAAMNEWRLHHFGPLDSAHTMRLVIPGATLTALGFQIMLSSFFLSILRMHRR